MQADLLLFMSITIIQQNKIFSIKVGDYRAVSGIPTPETICCQNLQQSAYLHHDYT